MRDQVFISYSHRDAAWLERLQVYLAPFERRGQLRRWDDTLIAPGERWAQEINEALGRARVAVLLVSAQFLASDFIARVELPRLLGAAEDQGVAILPLVIDWCNFERIPELAQFQSLNPPSQPLETMSESDAKAVLALLAAAVADTLQDGDVVGCERGRLVGLPARNPLFTGRDALLATLGEQLAGGGRVALCGIAGIGKTEAAIEYAHRYRNRHAWVLWSRAESIQPLLRGFCAIAAAFGLPDAPMYAGLFLVSLYLGTAGFFLNPVGAAISRRYEREADFMAWQLTGTAAPMIDALRRLAKDNLANLHPHPWYVWFYYSHPPLVQRIEFLQALDYQNPDKEGR